MEESHIRQQLSMIASLSESVRIVSNGLFSLAREMEFIHLQIEKIIKDDSNERLDDKK